MSDQRIPSQWQLQNTGESLEQWMLHEEEQNMPSHMQLSQQPGQGENVYQTQYQPGQAPYARRIACGSRLITAPCRWRHRSRPTAAASSWEPCWCWRCLALAAIWHGFMASQRCRESQPGRALKEAQAALPVETPAAVEETPAAAVVAPVGVIETPTPEATLPPTATPYLVQVDSRNRQFAVWRKCTRQRLRRQ